MFGGSSGRASLHPAPLVALLMAPGFGSLHDIDQFHIGSSCGPTALALLPEPGHIYNKISVYSALQANTSSK